VLHRVPSGSVDMVLTDPPYLVSYRGRWGSDCGVMQGDSNPCWVAPVFVELWRILRPDSLCLSFFGWPHADIYLGTWKLIGFKPVSQIICVKNTLGLGYFTRAQHEAAYLLAKGHPPGPRRAISDVFPWEQGSRLLHPTQKPLSTISRLIAAYAPPGSCLLDPFMGSGTTLVAARNLSCRAIGIEIEERYCEIAASRLSQEMFEFTEPQRTQDQQMLIDAIL
jgi:adenine-specific DNA-methyltransferase